MPTLQEQLQKRKAERIEEARREREWDELKKLFLFKARLERKKPSILRWMKANSERVKRKHQIWYEQNKDRIQKRARKKRQAYPEFHRERDRRYYRQRSTERIVRDKAGAERGRKELADSYIRQHMKHELGIEPTPEMIRAKREVLRVKRLVKQLKENRI